MTFTHDVQCTGVALPRAIWPGIDVDGHERFTGQRRDCLAMIWARVRQSSVILGWTSSNSDYMARLPLVDLVEMRPPR